jgi:hypothetical protein
MVGLFKKNLFFALALVNVVAVKADRHHDKMEHSHKIQVLINSADPDFSYNINNGTGSVVSGNLLETAAIGGYSQVVGLIYPKGTVSTSCACTTLNFAIDKDGNALNAANSLGFFYGWTAFLSNITFDAGSFPAVGTVLENVEWYLIFNSDCKGDNKGANNIFAVGQLVAGSGFSTSNVAMVGEGFPVAASECNQGWNEVDKVKVYFNGNTVTPQYLMKIKFKNEINYKKS